MRFSQTTHRTNLTDLWLDANNLSVYSSFKRPSNSHYAKAILIRVWCILLSLYTMYRAYGSQKNANQYALIGFPFLLVMFIEMYFAKKNNNFKENKYFNASLFLFSYSMLPSIWVLYINQVGFSKMQVRNKAQTTHARNRMIEMSEPAAADQMKFLIFTEHALLITLILSQWLLPKNRIDAEDIYSLVINSISMSLDMHELLHTGFRDKIIEDDWDDQLGLNITVLILSSWSWSLILLTVNSDAKTRFSHRAQNLGEQKKLAILNETYRVSYFKWDDQEYLPIIFENFYWKYLMTISAMDGPFFMVRMIIMVNYEISDVKHTFFLLKNLIQILLQLIRILGRICFRMA